MLKYGLPILAAIFAAFAVAHAVRTSQEQPSTSPARPAAPERPASRLVALGIVEARTGNIAIAAPVPGTVAHVLVEVGQEVAAGAPLFRLDDRSLQAELRLRQARLAAAQAQLARLEQMP